MAAPEASLPQFQLTIDSSALQAILQSFFAQVQGQLQAQGQLIEQNAAASEARTESLRQEMQQQMQQHVEQADAKLQGGLAETKAECVAHTDQGMAHLNQRVSELSATQDEAASRIVELQAAHEAAKAAEAERLKREEETAAAAAAAAEAAAAAAAEAEAAKAEAEADAASGLEGVQKSLETLRTHVMTEMLGNIEANTKSAAAAQATAEEVQEQAQALANDLTQAKETIEDIQTAQAQQVKNASRRSSRVSERAATLAAANAPAIDAVSNAAGSVVMMASIAALEEELDGLRTSQETMLIQVKRLESRLAGSVSAAEVQAKKQAAKQKALEDEFKKADKDGDGKVTKEEYAIWLKEQQEEKAKKAKPSSEETPQEEPQPEPSWDHKENGGFPLEKQNQDAEIIPVPTDAPEKVSSKASAEVKTFFTDADDDGDGELDFSEWTKNMEGDDTSVASDAPRLDHKVAEETSALKLQCKELEARVQKLEEDAENRPPIVQEDSRPSTANFQDSLYRSEVIADLQKRKDDIEVFKKKIHRDKGELQLLHPSKQAGALAEIAEKERQVAVMEGRLKRIENAPMDPQYFQKQLEETHTILGEGMDKIEAMVGKVKTLEELADQAEEEEEPTYSIETKWLEEINVLHSNIQALARDKTSASDVAKMENTMMTNLNTMKETLKNELSNKAERHDLEEVLKEVVATVESAALEPNEEAKVEALHAALNLIHREMQNKADDSNLAQMKEQLKQLEALRKDPAMLGRGVSPPRTASGVCLSCDRALDYASPVPGSRGASPPGARHSSPPATRQTPPPGVVLGGDEDPMMFQYANEWTKAPHSRANHFYRRGPQYALRAESAAGGQLPPVDRRHRLKREQQASRGASTEAFGGRSPTRGAH